MRGYFFGTVGCSPSQQIPYEEGDGCRGNTRHEACIVPHGGVKGGRWIVNTTSPRVLSGGLPPKSHPMHGIIESSVDVAMSGKPLDAIGWRTKISWFGDHVLDRVTKCANWENFHNW